MKAGEPDRRKAVMAVAKANPDLHEAYVMATKDAFAEGRAHGRAGKVVAQA
jgi:hypothetical protein